MIPAKAEPISVTPITEKSVESIADWFDHHKQSFFLLGWAYLKNQKQMEELFYRSILKVNKEFPGFSGKIPYETWVTSVFIQTCSELAAEGSLQVSEKREAGPDLFIVLDELKMEEKEAVALRYIKGISLEDSAGFLQVPVEKMKEHLFSAIQSLKKGMGYGQCLNGCKEYHKNYIDYLERTMDRTEKVEFEIHIYHCQDCQEDLAAFQEVMLKLLNFTEGINDYQVPSDLMGNVKTRLAEREKQRQLKNRKRLRMVGIFASIIAVLICVEIFTGAFTNLYYSYTEEDPQVRKFLQEGLGKALNLEAESNGVKITIKSAIADDTQTLVFYEIEDTAEENQYFIDFYEGVNLKNQLVLNNNVPLPMHYPPDLKAKVNNEKKNMFRGSINLLPLKADKGIIKLEITKLLPLIRPDSDQNNRIAFENVELKTGKWYFEIPVKKMPSAEYALDEQTEIEGVPVKFEKLIIAPTTTILQFKVNEQPEKRIEFLKFDNLKAGNKKVNAKMDGSYIIYGNMSWATFQAHFDPLFTERPKEVRAQLGSAVLDVFDTKTINLDPSQKYPQSFEYAGSTISIDKYEIGQPDTVVISNHDIGNRAYDTLRLSIVNEAGSEAGLMEMESDGILVDKNGKEYNQNGYIDYEKERPRYLTTVQKLGINNNNPGEKIRLLIQGYNTTKYLDDVVKISLD